MGLMGVTERGPMANPHINSESLKWHRTPWYHWRRLRGQVWRRFRRSGYRRSNLGPTRDIVYFPAGWEFQTDRQRAYAALEEHCHG
jgi:hypothetical protein